MDTHLLDALHRSGRFEIRRQLGSGGAGTVFRAYDRERDDEIALKVLHHLSSRAIYAFKREFRALADVDHPNLVRLHELLHEHGAWFFTMELLEGRDFADAVRHPGAAPSDDGDSSAAITRLEGPISRKSTVDLESAPDLAAVNQDATPTPRLSTTPLVDEAALRDALRQLALGLDALHQLGKLHRDLKPSNVLLTRDRRVVLLDFGLVQDLSADRSESLLDGLVGTPAYMAPEQAAGLALSPASDWYSVGVMLYQALTGRLPFPGESLAVLVEKQQREPVPPSRLAAGVPRDLDELCAALLRRDPAGRPGASQILALLGGRPETAPLRSRGSSTGSLEEALFLGREREIERINALARGPAPAAIAVVLAQPGLGASALLRRAIDQQRERHDALVLTGRCHLRESMPYKAFDGVVESLCRALRRLPNDEAERLLPYHVHALVRLFPLLDRVEAIAAAAHRRVVEVPDGQELRRRAFGAFRELLQRLSETRRIVIAIDDLHRGDDDSFALLFELWRPPDPPPALWLLALREDDPGSAVPLGLLASPDLAGPRLQIERIQLAPLDHDICVELASRLLDGSTQSGLAAELARESAGSPFALMALIRHAREQHRPQRSGSAPNLEEILLGDFNSLGNDARELLELLVVAGRGLRLPVLREAGAFGSRIETALTELRARRLVRIRGREIVEIAHEHTADTLSARLESARRKELHLRLARTLQASGDADPHELALHYEAAGELERAADHAKAAAELAMGTLAFDRAAVIYRLALELASDETTRRLLRGRLGDALAAAGRGREAASAYLLAAEGSLAADRLELRRRAAEQLLISGHIDEGLAAIAAVLDSIGMVLPATPRRALFSLLLGRLRLALRGLGFRERDASQVAAEKLIRIDTCWSVFLGLSIVDTIRGVDYGTRHLLLALEAGEPYRVARAMAVEAGTLATAGAAKRARREELVRRSLLLARQVGSPHAEGLATLMGGMGAYLTGQFRRARELFEEAEMILRERCSGVTWEIDSAVQFHLRSLCYLGELALLRARLPELLRDVRARGDLYGETNLRSRITWFLKLMDGDLDAARRELEVAIGAWTHHGFHVQHYWQLTGEVECDLWQGDGIGAWKRAVARWPAMAGSLLLRVEFTRVEAWLMRGRAALAALTQLGHTSTEAKAARRDVHEALRMARREHLAWSAPLADLLEAGLAAQDAANEQALELLRSAISGCRREGLELLELIAEVRLAEVIGAAARGRRRELEDRLEDQQIAERRRFLDTLAPGGWPPPRLEPA